MSLRLGKERNKKDWAWIQPIIIFLCAADSLDWPEEMIDSLRESYMADEA